MLAVAARARRQHAIEHVDPARDRADQIVGLADAHQIARLVGGKLRGRKIEHAEHRLLPLTHRKPADRIAVEADVGQRRGRARAQCLVERALLDAEQRSEEHTSELQSLMRISYAVFCLKKKTTRRVTKKSEDN